MHGSAASLAYTVHTHTQLWFKLKQPFFTRHLCKLPYIDSMQTPDV